MWSSLVLILTLVVIVISDSHAKKQKGGDEEEEYKIPAYMDLCYRDDPKVNTCIKKSIEKIVPLFKSGAKDFSLSPFDPMRFDDIFMSYSSRLFGGRISVTDLIMKGYSTIKVRGVRSNFKIPGEMHLEFDTHFDRLDSTGSYDINGNVARIPIKAGGSYNITFNTVDFTYIMDGETVSRNGSDFMEIKRFRLKSLEDGIQSVRIDTSDLVAGNPTLSRFAAGFINQFWRPIYKEMFPVLDSYIDRVNRGIMNKIFLKYPYDILLPKRTRKSINFVQL